MGLTIHYQGGLDRTSDLPALIDELEDIATSRHWTSQRVASPKVRGILISPGEECESLCFLFDGNGRLRSCMELLNEDEEFSETSRYVAVKTQYTKLETHVWIIGLLRYLKKHYLSNLDVSDEGAFWESGDVELLKKKKEFLQTKINQLSRALETSDSITEEMSIDDVVSEIESLFKKLK